MSTVSNVFITDVFTPNSVLYNQLLGASRVVNPLPTHTDEFETLARMRNALAFENEPPRSNPVPGAMTTVFAKRGSQREVGAILSACIDHTH